MENTAENSYKPAKTDGHMQHTRPLYRYNTNDSVWHMFWVQY